MKIRLTRPLPFFKLNSPERNFWNRRQIPGNDRNVPYIHTQFSYEYQVFKDQIKIYGKNRRQGDLQYILDSVKFKDGLDIRVDTIEKLPLKIPDTIERLDIMYAPWITLNYLMRLKLSKISFLNTNLTNEEINVFYKSWIEIESHLNLESFEINLTNPVGLIAFGLRDIPYEMGPMRPKPFSAYTPVEGSFEVTRNDGLTASICVYSIGVQFCAIMYTQLAHPEKNWL